MLKILHIAPQNYAGVPYSFFQMHNHCGDFSRIITLYSHPHNFPEDICLDLMRPGSGLTEFRKMIHAKERKQSSSQETPVHKPKNKLEELYFRLLDISRKPLFDKVIKEYDLDSFDIVHYDTGLDFYRNSSQARKWKKQGKKIVCCYYGSDLRLRGVIKEMDELSDLNITSEFDHLEMKSDLHYLFYPYDSSELPQRKVNESDVIKIVHSPTNRIFKGTDLILSVIDKLKKERKVEFILLENMKRADVLEIKSGCDICIDQVGGSMGGTGYGKAGLETLAMGIPTITNMTNEYADWLPENPFVVANNETELMDSLIKLIDDADYRREMGRNGVQWVKNYHSYEVVNRKLKELYKLKNIIQ